MECTRTVDVSFAQKPLYTTINSLPLVLVSITFCLFSFYGNAILSV